MYSPSASSVAAISLSTEFLAPGTTHLAVQRRGAANDDPVRFHGRQVWPNSTRCRTRCRLRASSLVACPAANGRCNSRGRPDSPEARHALTSRDDLVGEVVASNDGRSATFSQGEGPFTTYERSIVTTPTTVNQTIRYRLVIPWFGWLFALPAAQHPATSAA